VNAEITNALDKALSDVVICIANSRCGIPENLRPEWDKLPLLGVPAKPLAVLEEYLSGDTPMTDAQMQACCTAVSAFRGNGTWQNALD
jgi:hypothetical protein